MRKSESALYLIDASSYLYRAFHALPPLTSPSGVPTNAAYGFTTMLLKLLREAQPPYIAVVFDAPGGSFRGELYAEYKAQRPPMPSDLVLQIPLVHEIVAGLGLVELSVAGVEADDVIGTLAHRARARGKHVVVVSSDKDLMQIVEDGIEVWDTMRDRWFDTDAVRERFGVAPSQIVDLLGLMGDSVDNIPGVKGVGEKTATALIQRFGSIESVLADLDSVAAFSELRGAKKVAQLLGEQAAQARLSRQLATVKRDLDLDDDIEKFRLREPDAEPLRAVFQRLGFQRLLGDLTIAAPPLSVAVERIEDAAALSTFVHRCRSVGRLSISSHIVDGALDGVACALPTGETYYIAAPVLDTRFAELLGDERVEKVAHDLKADLHALRPIATTVTAGFDVMLASYLLEASSTHRLEDLAADLLGTNLSAFRDSAEGRAAGVSLLARLRDEFRVQLSQRGLDRLFDDIEMPLVGVLARIEQAGMQLDLGVLDDLRADLTSRMEAIVKEIYELAGGEFNISSPPQLREVLFDRLQLPTRGVKRGKTGLSTDVDVLTRLGENHPLPAKILEYRAMSKLKSTYVDALPAALNPISGRLHTTFNQTVAATGRLSSSDPNLQNIPIRGADGQRIRSAFVAPHGRQLIVADYSQIELRVLAHLSGDVALIAAFEAGEDIHARTAAEVFGVLAGTVSREMRRVAKVINFGIVYGMGAQALARELDVPVAQAEQYIINYFTRYAGVKRYLEQTLEDARRLGYVTTLFGRRRAMSALASRDRNAVQATERMAINTPIQGTAADLIKLAMVRIDRRLAASSFDAAMILQVHDELILEAAADAVPSVASLVREEMEGVYELGIPLKVEVGIGQSWAAAH